MCLMKSLEPPSSKSSSKASRSIRLTKFLSGKLISYLLSRYLSMLEISGRDIRSWGSLQSSRWAGGYMWGGCGWAHAGWRWYCVWWSYWGCGWAPAACSASPWETQCPWVLFWATTSLKIIISNRLPLPAPTIILTIAMWYHMWGYDKWIWDVAMICECDDMWQISGWHLAITGVGNI